VEPQPTQTLVMAMRLAVIVAALQPFIIDGTLKVVRTHMPLDDDAGDEYEYGDTEAAAADADTSDYSIHQFIAKDEARDPMGSDDNEADAAENDAQRSAILSHEEPFDSEDEPSPDNLLQKKVKHQKNIGNDDDGDMEEEGEMEYGDLEAASEDADTSDYSTHQFTAKDEARDPMGSDDSEADAAENDAERSKILSSEDTFDSEDEPSPDNFLQQAMIRFRTKVLSNKKNIGNDDDGDMEDEGEMEYGDLEASSEDADTSDYSVHQFIAKDEARDPMGSDDSEADAAENDAERSKILSTEDTFDSEDEPSPDNFLQQRVKRALLKKNINDDDDGDMEDEGEMEYGDLEAASEDADTSDYSVHQFIAKDEARDPMGSDDSEADAAENDAERSKILSTEDTFDSEDEPSPDNFLQKRVKRTLSKKNINDDDDGDMEDEGEMEYGDLEAASEDADTSDYSVHQFIAKDEARDPMGSDDSEADAAENDAERSKILSTEDTFDSEDEPSPDNFLQKRVKRAAQKRVKRALSKKNINDDDNGDMEDEGEMEYGDLEAASEDADTSDYSVHQFIAKDEARDPMGSDDSEADAAENDAERSKILSTEDTFDSEDEPSPDN